jgi:hypothetical protein
MESQIASGAVQHLLGSGHSHCDVASCGEAAAAEVDARQYCTEHFFTISFQHMQERHGRLKSQSFDPAAVTPFKTLLSSWKQEAKRLSEDAAADTAAKKARVITCMNWVSQAEKSLRRSPRVATAVPVWLRREDPRRTWEEDTWTSMVSRHGAGFVCRHPVETGGRVFLLRKDKGSRAEARVVYCRMDAEGSRQIGVELIDRDDFWD